MGALIQTKGTQRLAKWFNDLFDEAGSINIAVARSVVNDAGTALKDSFNTPKSLLEISDAFIAQKATAPSASTWPTGGNDVLYPSATMVVESVVSLSELQFKFPTGATPSLSAIPTFIAKDARVSCLNKRKRIDRQTLVSVAPTLVTGTSSFRVKLSKNVKTTLAAGDLVSFAQGKHEQLVRRWRWYLKNDLRPENDTALKQAVSSALGDADFKKITFQAIEDTQKVIFWIETLLDNELEFDDAYIMHIVLVTQQTTSPDPVDPQ